MTGAVMLTSPERVEVTSVAHLLQAGDIPVTTTADAGAAGEVVLVLALDLSGLDAAGELRRTRARLGGDVPAALVADLHSPAARQVAADAGTCTVIDAASSAEHVVRTLRGLLAPAVGDSEGRADVLVPVQRRPLDDPASAGRTLADLTPREGEIAEMISRGLRNDEVARDLGISVHTVRTHLDHVRDKLGVQHRVALSARLRELRVSAPHLREGRP